MAKTLAVLTANAPNDSWLLMISQPLMPYRMRIVEDTPDVSFRALSTADMVVLGPNVPRARGMMTLRALTRTRMGTPALAVVSMAEPVDGVLDYLRQGASAAILDTDGPGEFMQAVEQVSGGRLYLSSGLIPVMLKRYRELCAEMRRKLARGLTPSTICSRIG